MGPVSGGHFNPAVSFALYLSERRRPATTNADAAAPSPLSKLVAYVSVQLVAGICAGTSARGLHGQAMQLQPGMDLEGEQFGWKPVLTVELLYTFMLCFVVCRAALSETNPDHNEFFGMAISFVIIAGGYAGGWISKGAFNPAVAVGVDWASYEKGMGWCLDYTITEFLGGALAALFHWFLEDTTDPKYSRSDGMTKRVKAPLGQPVRWMLSEFLGTYFLVLTVGLNVIGGSPAGALSIAASLMCRIYALAEVSGAHFNPAVTTCLILSGKCELGKLKWFLPAQLLGGICASLSYWGLTGATFPLEPGAEYSWLDCAYAEIVYTFVLCFVVCNVATLSPHKTMTEGDGGASRVFFGLAIGFCIVAGGHAIGQVSGGSLNPAVSVAISTAHALKTGKDFVNCVCYSSFEIIGASLACMSFYGVRRDEFRKGR